LQLQSSFNSVGAALEEDKHYADDISKALDCIEKEVDELDEVIVGHDNFCALMAARGTTAIFAKAGCNHLKTINNPTFNISPSNLDNIPSKARSVGNRFITQI
jgi:fructoselysine-6-P-deglycase FrlB-like protein